MLGIVVGVAAVVCMVSVGAGAQAEVSEKIRTLGKLKDVTVSGIEVKTSTSLGKQWAVSGKATFEQRVMDFSVFLVDEKGSPKVVEYSFR